MVPRCPLLRSEAIRESSLPEMLAAMASSDFHTDGYHLVLPSNIKLNGILASSGLAKYRKLLLLQHCSIRQMYHCREVSAKFVFPTFSKMKFHELTLTRILNMKRIPRPSHGEILNYSIPDLFANGLLRRKVPSSLPCDSLGGKECGALPKHVPLQSIL